MRPLQSIPYIIAAAVGIGFLLFVHAVIKLPSEPFWASPVVIYENYAFAMALGLGFPYPMWSGALFLLLMMFVTFLFWRWILRKIFGKAKV